MMNFGRTIFVEDVIDSYYIGNIPDIRVLDKELFAHKTDKEFDELIEYWTCKGEFALALTFAKIKLHLVIDRLFKENKRYYISDFYNHIDIVRKEIFNLSGINPI